MPELTAFGDFQVATRDILITPKDVLLNESTKESYVYDLLFTDMDVNKAFRGGTKLVDRIQASSGSRGSFYNPNDGITPSQTDTLVSVEYPWAFYQNHYAYVEETTGLNAGDPAAYVNLQKSYEGDCMVNTVNDLDSALFALPNQTLMEAASTGDDNARVAMSILAFVTRDGEVPAAGNGGIESGSSAWTTIGQINPTTNDWWKNKFKTYTAANVADLGDGLLPAFDDIVIQTNFPMPTALRPWSDPKNTAQRKVNIFTSRNGIVVYNQVLRSINDRMASFTDPAINGPQFRGLPMVPSSGLDDLGWTDGSPDYLFLNLNFMHPFFRTGWFLKTKTMPAGVNQPNTDVTYKFVHYNLSCRSRRRQGRVSAG
jgi:hypothetical protein